MLCFLMLILNITSFLIGLPEVKAIDNNTYGIVYFRTKSCNTNTNYTVDGIGRAGYTNGCYGADGAFLGYSADKKQVKFRMAGVTGWVNASDVNIIDYYNHFDDYYTSNYYVQNGILKHVVTNDIYSYYSADTVILGPKPSFMTEGSYYWSYDGHYFYPATKDGFKTMITDYRNGNFNNSINKNSPYYNYYQYLTHRSMSNYTGKDIKSYFTSIGINSSMPAYPAKDGQSLLYGEQTSFVQYQNEFGANLGLVLGLARNESASGTSNIAFHGKNLFGHEAFDSSPGASATSYISVAQSIYAHTKVYISEGYLDPCDWRQTSGSYNESTCHKGRYYGGHAGDKNSGMNVKYASDPYWGEKMAQYYYLLDSAKGMQDYNKYTIAVKKASTSIGIYKDASNTSTLLYKTGVISDYPVIVLGEVTGQSINGNNKWYKIQADPVINANRTSIVQDSGYYNYENNYGYVHSSNFIKVNTGKAIKKRFTITFNPNGGKFSDGVTASKKLSVEQNVIPEINPPTKAGTSFLGWDKTVMGASADVTYTAKWAQKTYDITFNAAGGKFSDGSTSKVVKTVEGTLPSITNPTRSGYKFKGWDKTIANATAATTYTAVWEGIPTYKITFDANGGVFKDGSKTKVLNVLEGEKPTMTETPVKEDYIFTGWDKTIGTATSNVTYTAVYRKGTIEDVLTKKEGEFYLDYLKIVNNKLEIKGYNTIKGINNDLNTVINYELVLVDQNTKKEYVQSLSRLTDEKQMTIPIPSKDGKNYKYSWFKSSISFGNIPQGDYTAYVRSSTNQYYSKSYVQNMLLNDQVTEYTENARNITITNNYMDENIPTEFIIRDKKLGTKQTSYDVNQYSLIKTLEFVNGKLHIQAATYSVGVDMRKGTSLSRELIFENINTFTQTRINVDSLATPIYPIRLINADKFGITKDRAWFDKTIDIASLEKGTYAIYVTNKSNISDYGELYDLLFTDLSNSKVTINGKQYVFTLNEAKRNRIELTIK